MVCWYLEADLVCKPIKLVNFHIDVDSTRKQACVLTGRGSIEKDELHDRAKDCNNMLQRDSTGAFAEDFNGWFCEIDNPLDVVRKRMGGVIYMVRMHTTGSDDTDKISQCGKRNQSEGVLYIILVIISKGLIGRGTFSKRKALLLGMAVLASRFCSIRADTDFIPIRANSNFCNIDYSKLPNKCGSDVTYAIHCVYDSDGQLGICCTERLWIPKGNCPFFSKAFGVLDYQPCFAEACPNDKDWYMSDEASMYPGCLSNNFTSVTMEILVTETTTHTRQSVTDSFNSHETYTGIGLPVLIACVGCVVVFSLVYLWNCGRARREAPSPPYGSSGGNLYVTNSNISSLFDVSC